MPIPKLLIVDCFEQSQVAAGLLLATGSYSFSQRALRHL